MTLNQSNNKMRRNSYIQFGEPWSFLLIYSYMSWSVLEIDWHFPFHSSNIRHNIPDDHNSTLSHINEFYIKYMVLDRICVNIEYNNGTLNMFDIRQLIQRYRNIIELYVIHKVFYISSKSNVLEDIQYPSQILNGSLLPCHISCMRSIERY